MSVLWLSEEETRALEALLASDLSDPIGTLRASGYDGAAVFEHVVLDGLDLRGSDVAGLSFFGSSLDHTILYRDQYEAIRSTGPRSMRGVRVLEREQAAASLEEFLAVLAEQADYQRRTGRHALAPLEPIMRRLPGAEERARALLAVLRLWPDVVATGLAVAAAGDFADDILAGLAADPALAPVSLGMRLAARATLRPRLDLVEHTRPPADHMTPFVQALLARGAGGIAALRPAIDLLAGLGAEPHAALVHDACRAPLSQGDLDTLLAILARFPGIADARVLFALLRDTKTLSEAEAVLARLRAAGLPADRTLYAFVAERAKNMADVHAILRLMERDDVTPDHAIFLNLLRAARSIAAARELLGLMHAAGVPPERPFFSSLPDKAGSLDEAMDVLKLMRRHGVPPDGAVFTRIADRARTLAQGRRILERMRSEGVRIEEAVFTRLADRAESLEDGVELLELMTEFDVEPTAVVFSRIADNVKTLDDVDRVLAMMAEHGVAPTKAVFSRLADGARGMSGVRALLARLRSARLVPDAAVFSRLADQPATPGEAREFLRLMQDVSAEPSVDILSALVGACASVDDAAPLLEGIQKRGGRPELNDLNRMLLNAPNAAEARRSFEAIARAGRKPDHYSFSTLLSKQDSYAAARAVVATQSPPDVSLDLFALNPVLRQAEKLSHVLETLGDVAAAGLGPDVYSVKALLDAELRPEDVRLGLAAMLSMGLRPEALDTGILGARAERFAQLVAEARAGEDGSDKSR